jgi:hypothetical protein
MIMSGEKDIAYRRNIRLIEGNANSRHLTKLTLWQVFICLRPRTPYPHTVFLFTQTQGSRGGGRVEPERRVEGKQFTKLGRNYQHVSPVYTHLPQSPCTGQFF